MKKAYTILLTLFHFACLAQEIKWLSHYGAANRGEFIFGMVLAPDGQGNVYGAGSCYRSALDIDGIVLDCGYEDILIVKWDSTGQAVWAKDDGGTGGPQYETTNITAIAYDSVSDEVTVAGYFTNIMYFDHDTLGGSGLGMNSPLYLFTARYAQDGECLWARRTTGSIGGASDILRDQNGASYVFWYSTTNAVAEGQPDILVPAGGSYTKYSSTGDLLAAERIVINGRIGGAEWLSNDSLVLCGYFTDSGDLLGTSVTVPPGTQSGFIALADLNGGVEWLVQLNSSSFAGFSDLKIVDSDHLIAKGAFWEDVMLPNDTLYGSSEVLNSFIASFSRQGDMQWLVQMESPQYCQLGSNIETDGDGNVFIIGEFEEEVSFGNVTLTATTGREGFIAKFDSLGVCKAAWNFGKVFATIGSSVIPGTDGIYFSCLYDSTFTIADHTIPDPTGQSRFMVVGKLDSLSGFTGIQSKVLIDETLLIYANPNNGLCTVQLPESLEFTRDLMLTIYDAQGREVQQIPIGNNTGPIPMDIRAQARGIYHVEVSDGLQRYSGRIIFE